MTIGNRFPGTVGPRKDRGGTLAGLQPPAAPTVLQNGTVNPFRQIAGYQDPTWGNGGVIQTMNPDNWENYYTQGGNKFVDVSNLLGTSASDVAAAEPWAQDQFNYATANANDQGLLSYDQALNMPEMTEKNDLFTYMPLVMMAIAGGAAAAGAGAGGLAGGAGFGAEAGALGGLGAEAGAGAAGFGAEAGAGLGGLEGAGSVTFDPGAIAGVDTGTGLTTPMGGAEGGAFDMGGSGNVFNTPGGGAPGTGSTFSWTDPSTWSNPFSSTPPGSTTAAQQLFNSGGDMAGELGGSGGSASGSFDWSKFFSGSGNGWLNLLGSGVGALSSWLASNAQVKSAEEANALLWAMYNQNRADAGPYREAGYGALANMVNLTTPGKQFDQMQLDPGYQFRLGEGNQAIDRAAAARGMYGSGRALKELTRYGQNFASNEFGNVYNRNASLAGLGQTAVTNTGQLGANTANQVGANTIGAGNATASGYVGVGNAVTGGIQNYLNSANQNAWLQAILAGRTSPYG